MLTPPYAHVKMNFQQSTDPHTWLNDFWFSITGTFPGGWNVKNACIALENHFKSPILACLNSEVKYIGADLLVNNAGIVATSSTYTTDNGHLTDNLVPIEVAVIVRMQSSAAGRRGRGRIYLGGLNSTSVDGGRIDPSFIAPFSALGVVMQTSLTDQGVTYVPAVYSRKDSILYNVQYCTVDAPLGTQRRRRAKR